MTGQHYDAVVGSAAAGLRAETTINADVVAEDPRQAPFSAEAEREVCERVLSDRRHGL